MSTTALAAPIRVNTAGVHARPGLGRLVAVELRKMVDTRAGFWLQVAMVVLTVVVVVVRLLVGDAADHTFQSVIDAGLQPAAVLLPVLGILLVTSEWSQRTALITFALVPVRSRVLGGGEPAQHDAVGHRRAGDDLGLGLDQPPIAVGRVGRQAGAVKRGIEAGEVVRLDDGPGVG